MCERRTGVDVARGQLGEGGLARHQLLHDDAGRGHLRRRVGHHTGRGGGARVRLPESEEEEVVVVVGGERGNESWGVSVA